MVMQPTRSPLRDSSTNLRMRNGARTYRSIRTQRYGHLSPTFFVIPGNANTIPGSFGSRPNHLDCRQAGQENDRFPARHSPASCNQRAHDPTMIAIPTADDCRSLQVGFA
jgi:hypothetical protein